jgi:CHRD domain
MLRRILHILVVPAAVFTAGRASAQITHFESFMDGSQEVPPVVTAATGRADYTLNTSSHVLKYNLSFQNLSSAQTAAHIHRADTSIMLAFPIGSAITGSFATTAMNEAQILVGNTYTNIHSTMHGGGEIRGTNVFAPALGTAMCFGDGTGGACPCGNNGAAGHGCENSSTTGGSLLAASGHVSPDNVVLIATGEKPTALSIFIQGNSTVPPTVFGDGLRCINGLKRLQTKNATGGAVAYPEGAEPSITTRAAALGQPNNPGDVRGYQVYYRDPDLTFCASPPGNTFNISNVVQLTW